MLTILLDSLTEAQELQTEISEPLQDNDFDDNNDDDELMSQANGLIRLREDTGALTPSQSRLHRKSCDDIARFTEESLHSFGFTQPFRDQNTFEARRSVVSRSFDFMKKLRDKLDTVKLESVNETSQPSEDPLMMEDIADIKRPAFETSTSPRSRRTQTAFDPIDTHVALVAMMANRRASIDTDLMPLSAKPGQNHAVHPPTRFLPQNQGIVTTNEDGKILLFNDMASLCFGYDKSYVGQSILNVFESSSKDRLRLLLNARSSEIKQLNTEQDRGTVLICGKVVCGTFFTKFANFKPIPSLLTITSLWTYSYLSLNETVRNQLLRCGSSRSETSLEQPYISGYLKRLQKVWLL
jgi:hypothetical protein